MTQTLNPTSGSQYSIRPATPADLPRLTPLINSAFAIETFLEGNRTDETRLADMMQQGTILVVEDPSVRILACVYLEIRGNRGYMGQLAVDPAHQGGGLARVLVNAAEDHLRNHGCEAVDIVVLSLRPELPPIYRRFGYVETGTEEFKTVRALKPGHACHGILMSKKL
jgi:predicted N-acetyltransferase YhbS